MVIVVVFLLLLFCFSDQFLFSQIFSVACFFFKLKWYLHSIERSDPHVQEDSIQHRHGDELGKGEKKNAHHRWYLDPGLLGNTEYVKVSEQNETTETCLICSEFEESPMSCVVLSKIPTTACGLLCITAPKREVVLLHSCRQSQERRAAEYHLKVWNYLLCCKGNQWQLFEPSFQRLNLKYEVRISISNLCNLMIDWLICINRGKAAYKTLSRNLARVRHAKVFEL